MGRVCITGIGVISALGSGRENLVRGIKEDICGIKKISLLDASSYRSSWAGQAPEPSPLQELGPFRRCSRADLLALQAATEALGDAKLAEDPLVDTAVVIGTGAGGTHLTEAYRLKLLEEGEEGAPASWLIPHQPANTADLIANRFAINGPRLSLMTACSSSATALGVGLDMIRLGRAKRVLAGGTESLCHLTYGGFSALRAMDDQPCRPFHADRHGLTLGDGSSMLVLEDLEQACSRGVVPYAELAGYGVSADAYHLTAPAPDGRGAVAAMTRALEDAGIDAGQVQYINAHGTATPHNDPIEVASIKKVFGPHAEGLAISSTKAMTGHTLGAAGALEAAICAVAIREGIIPATLRLDRPDPACDLDLVPCAARAFDLSMAMSNSFAFGGNNTSLVVRRIS